MLPASRWAIAAALVTPLTMAALSSGPVVGSETDPSSSPSQSPSQTVSPSPSEVPTVTPTPTPTPTEPFDLSPELGMESELAALGLPTGPVDGIIDSHTRRAICAFRDLTGVQATRALPSPELMLRISMTTALPDLPKKLRSVKALVSLTCQTAYITDERGTVIRTLPVSTGKDRGYHATRTGFKRVYYKYNAWQRSALFPEPDGRPGLYRPVYFDRGIAFHGVRKPIRTKPQSHGCVRTWPKDQDWLFKQLDLRDKVFVYGDYWRRKTASLGGFGPRVPYAPPGYTTTPVSE